MSNAVTKQNQASGYRLRALARRAEEERRERRAARVCVECGTPCAEGAERCERHAGAFRANVKRAFEGL